MALIRFSSFGGKSSQLICATVPCLHDFVVHSYPLPGDFSVFQSITRLIFLVNLIAFGLMFDISLLTLSVLFASSGSDFWLLDLDPDSLQSE